MFWALVHLSQTVVTVKDGSSTAVCLPVELSMDYTYSQQIYLQSEINKSGEIYAVFI